MAESCSFERNESSTSPIDLDGRSLQLVRARCLDLSFEMSVYSHVVGQPGSRKLVASFSGGTRSKAVDADFIFKAGECEQVFFTIEACNRDSYVDVKFIGFRFDAKPEHRPPLPVGEGLTPEEREQIKAELKAAKESVLKLEQLLNGGKTVEN